MTTTVTVHAHCASTTAVHVAVTDQPTTVLQDGQKADFYAYDHRVISVKEVADGAPAPMTFGDAITALKNGAKVARAGWNGKGMFVYLVPANSYPAQTGAAKTFFGDGGMVPYNAYLALKGMDDTVSTWAPSGSDALSEDWHVVA